MRPELALDRELLVIAKRFSEYAFEITQYPAAVNKSFTMFAHLQDVARIFLYADDINSGLAEIAAELDVASQANNTLLHCHLSMGLWSAFEAALQDIVVAVIAREPYRLEEERLKGTRIPIAEALKLSSKEMAYRIVDEYKVTGDGKGRADTLLSLVGMSAPVEPTVARRILELQQLRNVIAHRGSIIDEKLVLKCPWLRSQLGQRVVIEYEQMELYSDCLNLYIATAVANFARLGEVSALLADRLIQPARHKIERLETKLSSG